MINSPPPSGLISTAWATMQQAKSEKSQGICANIRVKGRRGINARTHYTHIEDIAACAQWPRIIAVPWRCAFFAEQTLVRPLIYL